MKIEMMTAWNTDSGVAVHENNTLREFQASIN